jgi:hypothetical protein
MKGRRIDVASEESTEKHTALKVTAKPKTLDKDEFLSAVTSVSISKEPSKKNNGIQTLVPPEKLRLTVDEIVQWKQTEKEAKAEREAREAKIVAYVQPIQEEHGWSNNYQKSYYVKGLTNEVTFVSSDRFPNPKVEEIPELQELLGDRFEEIIKKEIVVSLRPEVMTNPELKKNLVEALKVFYGEKWQAAFATFFVSETRYSVVDGFDRKRFSLKKRVFEKISEILRQAKPAIK